MPDTNDVTVEVKDLTRFYGKNSAVDHVSFYLKRGEVLGFLGPNGAGKSTTMKMITGNLSPTAGEIKICGIDILEFPKQAKALIGYLPEVPPLYREFTVDEFLTLSAKIHGVARGEIKKALQRVKESCGLQEMSHRLIDNLSKGYQQRVGIAQAIIHNPMVVILDEPTVGLDPIQIREIRALIRELSKEHSVILSTHILPEVEMVCDRVQVIDRGKLVFNADIASFKQQRQTNHLLIGLHSPPAMEVLRAFPFIVNVESVDEGLYRLQHSQEHSPAEQIVVEAVKNNWGLYQIQPDLTSVEDVFVQLTRHEN